MSELATKLARKPVTIQQNYVAKLVSDGLLAPRYPTTPNHPAQAYRARRVSERTDD